ncbi:hypothetical protein ENUP19_0097G0005 [Entamoeba nuttalli]|uniref:Uncharacterized protein n=1 Tax=Entamoeba nuttalli TaxID=412467 RepID=A0ABQ0DH36_9EUKA
MDTTLNTNQYLPLSDQTDDKWEMLDDMIPIGELTNKENLLPQQTNETEEGLCKNE